jgi:hypothetical protein
MLIFNCFFRGCQIGNCLLFFFMIVLDGPGLDEHVPQLPLGVERLDLVAAANALAIDEHAGDLKKGNYLTPHNINRDAR